MDFGVSFRALLIEPLEAAIGHKLIGITYWLVYLEKMFFELDMPNASGLCAISLIFEGAAVAITPAWDKALRSENIYHYIQAQLVPVEDKDGELESAELLLKIPADRAIIWRNAFDTLLIEAEMYGVNHTPQAIRLVFASTTVVVSLGYSGDDLYIGDGDEILVFSDEQWRSHPPLSETMTKMWTSVDHVGN